LLRSDKRRLEVRIKSALSDVRLIELLGVKFTYSVGADSVF